MHQYTEFAEKNFFVPVHEFIWDKDVSQMDIDGQSAFYYAMEYMYEHFSISSKLAFEIASDIMQETWEVHLDRMRAEHEEKSVPNNYDVWTDDDLPF